MLRSVERLSSGLRINRAQDDAAGLAISVRIDAIVRGQNVAIRNTNDAISYMQIGQGALSTISNCLLHMRDLAIQSGNGAYSDSDRVALNVDLKQYQSEISRITSNTTFNGQSIFAGTAMAFQIGADATSNSQITFQGTNLIVDTSKTGSAALVSSGVTQANVNTTTNQFIAQGGTFSSSDGTAVGAGSASVASIITRFEQGITAADLATFATKKNAFVSAGGSFSTSDGEPVMAKSGTSTVIQNPGPSQVVIQVPISTQTDIDNYDTFITARTDYFAAARGIQVLDAKSATVAMSVIDKALEEVSQENCKFGVSQNTLTGALSNLETSTENQSATMSRITDADYAVETSNLTRSKILQQMGMAMLAQANQLPNTVLMLLKVS
ncbi:MAG: hypothetical protein RIR18_473 [Pseudomonadota bacterium]|jgi:flagellin